MAAFWAWGEDGHARIEQSVGSVPETGEESDCANAARLAGRVGKRRSAVGGGAGEPSS